MTRHVREHLYDFLTNEVSPEERSGIEKHLRTCAACTADLDSLRTAAGILSSGTRSPSDDRNDALWTSLLDRVDEEIRVERGQRSSPRPNPLTRVGVARFRRIGYAAAGSGVFAVAATILFLVWPRQTPPEEPSTRPPLVLQRAVETPEAAATRRLNEYYRRSKVLMVGLANMKDQEQQQLDLSREQKQSRTLVREARELRRYPLDHRSDRLVGDVQKILIGLSNINEMQKAPEVEILQAGIQRENLLFRVRMAEYATNITATEGNIQ